MLKSVTKNITIKRTRFGAPPPRHMMFGQGRASIHEKTHAIVLRDRAREAHCMIEPHALSTMPNNLCVEHLFCELAVFVECALGVHDHAYVPTAASLIPRTAPSFR